MSWVLVVRFVPSWAGRVFLGSGGGIGLLSGSTLSGNCSAGVTGVSMFSDICGSSTLSDTGSKLTDIFCNYIFFEHFAHIFSRCEF